MLDLTTENGRLVSAALALAAERPWRDVTLADIAARARTTLVDVRRHFSSKSDVLATFTRLVDDEGLRRSPVRDSSQSSRDALFEVVMCRFDVLEPYKGALKSIAAAGLPEPSQALNVLASQRWMLEAAGIGTGGFDGGVKIAGLASVYASVFRTWLDDDDAGLARTMAALDRRLSPAVVSGLALAVGGLHGWLNGAGIAADQREWTGLLGIAVAIRKPWARLALRVAGSWVAAMGLLLLGWSLRAAG